MTEHDYASPGYLPNLGEDPSIEDIAEEITPDEIGEVALHDSKYGNGMYDQCDFLKAFEQYQKTGDTDSALVDPKDLRTAVLRAGLDSHKDFERFLYSPVGEHGEFRFYAEGEYKRIHRDRRGEKAIIEGKPQTYSPEDQRALLKTVINDHNIVEDADVLRPPSREPPELVEYYERPILMYSFNQGMTPISDLKPEERQNINELISDAEKEMKELIEEDRFQTVQPQDFHFQTNERAREHINIPADLEDFSELDELIISDLGEISPSYDKSSKFAIN